EILRRILAETLDSTFAPKDTAGKGGGGSAFSYSVSGPDNNLVTELWAGNTTASNSRGFHAPGLGVFFALDVSLPVVEKNAQGEPGREEPSKDKDEEWDSMRKQVRNPDSGNPLSFRARVLARSRETEIDPQAIDQTVDAVLKTLARHASRIEGLNPND